MQLARMCALVAALAACSRSAPHGEAGSHEAAADPDPPAARAMRAALVQTVAKRVRDGRVLDAIGRVPRHRFVANAPLADAYGDWPLPIGGGQTISQPSIVGEMTEALELLGTERVLEIGTGSGYLTACLASFARRVNSVEIHADLAAGARARLAAQGIANAQVQAADAFALAFDPHHDVIVLTGSLPKYDERFQHSLAVGGRLFAIVGDGPAMSARLVRRTSSTTWTSEDLFETWVEPLVHAARPSRFVF